VVLVDPPPSSSWNRQTIHPVLSWLGTAAACASRSRCNERPGQVSRAVSRHWWIIARNIRDSSSACRLLIPWRLAFIALTALPPTVSDRLTAHPRVPVANERRLPLPSFRCPAVAHDSGPIVRLTDSSEVPRARVIPPTVPHCSLAAVRWRCWPASRRRLAAGSSFRTAFRPPRFPPSVVVGRIAVWQWRAAAIVSPSITPARHAALPAAPPMPKSSLYVRYHRSIATV
jgi:hypothetical protein